MRWRNSLAVPIIGLLTVGVVAVSLVTHVLDRNSLRSAITLIETDKLNHVAGMITSMIKAEESRTKTLVNLLRFNSELITALEEAGRRTGEPVPADRIPALMGQALDPDLFRISDSQGRILHPARKPGAEDKRSMIKGLKQALEGQVVTALSRDERGWSITTAGPVAGPDRILGTVAVGLRIDRALAVKLAESTETMIAIRTPSGEVESSSVEVTRMIDEKALTMAGSIASGQVVAADDASRRTILYRPIEILGHKFGLAVIDNFSQARSIYDQRFYRSMPILGAVILAGALIGAVLTVLLLRPLKRLRAQAERNIRELSGRDLELEGENEIKSLVISIGAMIEVLKKRIASLTVDEARFRELSDLLPIVIVEINRNREVTYLNRMGVEAFGGTEGDPEKGLEPDRFRVLMDRLDAALAGEQLQPEEYRLTRVDGRLMEARVNSAPILRDGEIVGLRATIEDVTEWKRDGEAIRASEVKYRELVEQAGSIIMRFDPQGRVTFANEFALAFFGYPEDELLWEPASETINPEFDSQGNNTAEYFRNIYRHPEEYSEVTHENIDGQGLIHWVSWTNQPVKDKSGRLLEVLSVGKDITELRTLLDRQKIDIRLAQILQGLVTPPPDRSIILENGLSLYAESISVPCYDAGGDHTFIHHQARLQADVSGRSIISLKDQSGHEVGCVLRSIATDLIHQDLFRKKPGLVVEESIRLLNNEVTSTGLFKEDDFCTAMVVGVDHDSLRMSYVSAGHPPGLLIRGDTLQTFPEQAGPGSNPPLSGIPGLNYTAGQITLEPGDKLILYSDGLTEMPLAKGREKFELERLGRLAQEYLIDRPEAGVSALIKYLLEQVAAEAGEMVGPGAGNTSDDDVTIIGLELETDQVREEEVWYPVDEKHLAGLISELSNRLVAAWSDLVVGRVERTIPMILEEAILNAWKHGNRSDGSKSIRISWWATNEAHIMVEDEGAGFDPEKVEDPLTSENLIKPFGRGIFLMKRFAHRIRWIKGGRCLAATLKTNSGLSPKKQ